jgi:hypothetical protein
LLLELGELRIAMRICGQVEGLVRVVFPSAQSDVV